MMALGSTALHLWIAEFKFTHNFIICNQLPETNLFLASTIQKEVFIIICLGQGQKLLYTTEW